MVLERRGHDGSWHAFQIDVARLVCAGMSRPVCTAQVSFQKGFGRRRRSLRGLSERRSQRSGEVAIGTDRRKHSHSRATRLGVRAKSAVSNVLNRYSRYTLGGRSVKLPF